MELLNRKISNFLSDEEIFFIEDFIHNSSARTNMTEDLDRDNKLICNCYNFNLYQPEFEPIAKILLPKISKNFGPELLVETSHLLESYKPYGIHSDVYSGNHKEDSPIKPAYTFIVPLDNYDSNTIVFNEQSPNIKTVEQWINFESKEPINIITDEFIEQYLDHCWAPHIKYLTVEDVFLWTKGTLFASNRAKFHTSDNYIKRGIGEKRALIFWTGFN